MRLSSNIFLWKRKRETNEDEFFHVIFFSNWILYVLVFRLNKQFKGINILRNMVRLREMDSCELLNGKYITSSYNEKSSSNTVCYLKRKSSPKGKFKIFKTVWYVLFFYVRSTYSLLCFIIFLLSRNHVWSLLNKVLLLYFSFSWWK